MALVTLVAGQTARAAHLNSNFALCVLTDTARTISVTHTWSASQTFTGGFTTGAASTLGGNLLFTDATYDIGASGATRPRDFYLSRNAVIGGTLTRTGVATFTAAPVFSSGTASQTVELNGSKALTTVAITGTGNYVKSASPTFTGTIALAAATASGLITANAGATVASGQTLTLTGATVAGAPTWSSTQSLNTSGSSGSTTGNAATATALATARTLWGQSFDGTANVTAEPTFGAGATVSSGQTLTVTGATITGLTAASVGTGTFPGVYTITGAVTLSSTLAVMGASTFGSVTANPTLVTQAADGGYQLRFKNAAGTLVGGFYLDGGTALHWADSLAVDSTLAVTGATTLSGALTYGGVTLSNAVTGTGNMVLSASPTLTGTIAGAAMTLSSTLAVTGVSTLTGDVIASVIRRGTSDGSDDSLLSLYGGGGTSPTRGAMIRLYGNENANPGGLNLYAGAAGTIDFFAGASGTDFARITSDGGFGLADGISAPATVGGFALLYVDTADGDLKVKFGDGVVKTLATDT